MDANFSKIDIDRRIRLTSSAQFSDEEALRLEILSQRKRFYLGISVLLLSFCLGSLAFTFYSRNHCHQYFETKCKEAKDHDSECTEMALENKRSIFEVHDGYHLNLSEKNRKIFGNVTSTQFNMCFNYICRAMGLYCQTSRHYNANDTKFGYYLLIKPAMYSDCGVPGMVGSDETVGAARCQKNRDCAVKCVENYWMRNGENCLSVNASMSFCEAATRIVWAGPQCQNSLPGSKEKTDKAAANVNKWYAVGSQYDFDE